MMCQWHIRAELVTFEPFGFKDRFLLPYHGEILLLQMYKVLQSVYNIILHETSSRQECFFFIFILTNFAFYGKIST